MCFVYLKCLFFIFTTLNALDLENNNFHRVIEATSYPYYKILLKLGSCKDTLIYSDHRAWPSVHLNRVLDIYYKSNTTDVVVSAVNIQLFINNTDFLAVSNSGVGTNQFGATIFFAMDTGPTYFIMNVYSCSK